MNHEDTLAHGARVPGSALHTICLARNQNVDLYEGLTEAMEETSRLCGPLTLLAGKSRRTWPVAAAAESPVDPKRAPGFLRLPTLARLFLTAVSECIRHRRGMIFGCDPLGNVVASVVAGVFRRPYVHYGLELPPARQDGSGYINRLIRWSHRKADIIITMDEPHAEFICRETGALRERILLIPNSRRGPGRKHQTRTLRDRFGLSEADVVVLHAGGIGAAQGSKNLASAAAGWKRGHHLVFHAHCPMGHEPYYQGFRNDIQACKNVHLNEESVSSGGLDDVVGGADIGIAWYDRARLGYRAELLGLAAGKIGRYLRNGVPVIVCDLPTVRTYVDTYRCGVCIKDTAAAAPAVETIMSDYETYSANALRCYEELWRPDRHLAEFRVRLNAMISHRMPEPRVNNAK